ncbi:PREDICTED: tektin-4 [Eufriesea mexicana]|uniref:tektin-4 n=1 Tax=Eufriesea mexicana TaxID=516756 RepID=UPI00083BCC86|nr:PREDICTED: tektin-4 [Eufriesea mexicana]
MDDSAKLDETYDTFLKIFSNKLTQPCPRVESTKTSDEPPLYFPQSGDDLPAQPKEQMDPIGPWATGRVTFTPQDGLTGIRPVVDRYSITSFGAPQWRSHNQKFFMQSNEKIQEAQLAVGSAKRCVERSYMETDRTQLESTDHLKKRAGEVYRWKIELEHLILDITKEIELLETEYRRVKHSLSVLTVPEAIAGEFLQLRSKRLESDLIRDEVEEELTKEIALCSEIRDLFGRTREQIEMQITELKAAKVRMEVDWTDKTDAYAIDSECIKLKNDSSTIVWKLGATRFPAEQSTPSSYEHYTRESLTDAEAAKQRSMNLRSTLNSIYKNSIKDLRDQATRVDLVLGQKIKLTEDIHLQLEKELLRCLHELANTEKSIQELRHSTRGLDCAMKVAQTRLANRLQRRNVESCRDIPQFALVEEVKLLNERTSAVLAELKRAEETQAGLVKARGDLEREIVVKRKTLYIDKQRGQLLRSFYPSTI